jgi:hypothetical protein
MYLKFKSNCKTTVPKYSETYLAYVYDRGSKSLKKKSLHFNPVLRQAVLTMCPLNLCILQSTYRPDQQCYCGEN